MPPHKVIFEANETISGVVPRANDWIKYSCILKIKDGGKLPVTLEMTFVPPHPFSVNMPLTHSIQAQSITSLYFKIITFLHKYDVEFRA